MRLRKNRIESHFKRHLHGYPNFEEFELETLTAVKKTETQSRKILKEITSAETPQKGSVSLVSTFKITEVG